MRLPSVVQCDSVRGPAVDVLAEEREVAPGKFPRDELGLDLVGLNSLVLPHWSSVC